MIVEDIKSILASLDGIIKDGVFWIAQYLYDESASGNMYIVLESKVGIYVRFIRDRGDISCEIKPKGLLPEWREVRTTDGWYTVDDVFSYFKIDASNRHTDMLQYLAVIATALKNNIDIIATAFNENNIDDTIAGINMYSDKKC